MYKRIHLKKKNKHKIRDFSLLIILFVILCVSICFKFINKRVSPVLLEYATSESTKLATLIITASVNNEVFSNIETNDLFEIEKDSNNNIKYVDFDSVKINKLLNLITNSVKEYLEQLENGNIEKLESNKSIFENYKYDDLKRGIIYEIPTGVIFNNSLLSNLGPRVPVRMNMIGDVETNVDTSVTSYGINNALLKVIVNVKVSLKVILPFSSKIVTTETDIPIAMKMVSGEVPSYYYLPITSS